MRGLTINQTINLTLRSPTAAFNAVYDHLHNIKLNKFPRILTLSLTEKCNFRCPMCHVKESRTEKAEVKTLDFEYVIKVVQESRKYSPYLLLFGGEPTLYDFLKETIELAVSNRLITSLPTNGMLLEKCAEDLVKSQLHFLSISLDGWDQESQAKRGGVLGSFDAILRGINEVVR